MAQAEVQQAVRDLLQSFRGEEPLKRLFWSELNYDRIHRPLARRSWPSETAGTLAEDPILLAAGGEKGDFHVIYARLRSERLLRGLERPVVSRLLQDHPYALFVFSNAEQNDWHFLNVKLAEDPSKRRLFRRITVAPGEHLRTASERVSLLDLGSLDLDPSRLSPLRIQERHDEAFDVEPVTKEFFRQYREVFELVEKQIQGPADRERRRLFTQKLFNRLMFIAFIQKKGWLEFDSSSDRWYLSALWAAHRKDKDPKRNFYRDRLHHLFFTGLGAGNDIDIIGINRGGLWRDLIGQVPYLNGGLFEEEEDDRNLNFTVPDQCIAAILEALLNRFNFTVTESTPLDVEVAVDPEMLGKVFEELVTGRHETGSYYTPKPIVSFMCREALKGYLATVLPDECEAALAQFVDEHSPGGLKDPEAVLDALRRVRVCDPACGSGAYLLGMLHELLELRSCLFEKKRLDAISTYERKLDIIQQNLYGVDIDEFAVNIAQLRLWLSLSVDFEGDNPPPLPNLDFKIEVGDSLSAPRPLGSHLFRQSHIEEYFKLKADYLKAHGVEKLVLREKIDKVRSQIAGWAHPREEVSGFDWPVEFAEVFADGGFDAILANPPYVRQELIKGLKPLLKERFPLVYHGVADLYVYFYARSLELLRNGGMLAFISPNKWFRANYGTALRRHIGQNCDVVSITDFGELPVFESSATFPMIFVAQNSKPSQARALFTQVKSLDPPYPDVLTIVKEQGQVLPDGAVSGSAWILTDTISSERLRKMERSGVSLEEYVRGNIYYGVKTGFNRAFVIDSTTRKRLIAEDRRSSELIKPLAVGDDIRRWRIERKDRWLIFTRRGIDINGYPAVKRHLAQWRRELEPRPPDWPSGKHWPGRKPGSYKWCEIQDEVAYHLAFEKSKIVFPDIAKEARFVLDNSGIFINNTAYFISTDELYLLGTLNSWIVWQYCKERLTVLGDANKGGRLRFFRQFVRSIPIPNASSTERAAIAAFVQKCLDAKGLGCEGWETEIDERVATLYGLD